MRARAFAGRGRGARAPEIGSRPVTQDRAAVRRRRSASTLVLIEAFANAWSAPVRRAFAAVTSTAAERAACSPMRSTSRHRRSRRSDTRSRLVPARGA